MCREEEFCSQNLLKNVGKTYHLYRNGMIVKEGIHNLLSQNGTYDG